jgi:hypothetical protein
MAIAIGIGRGTSSFPGVFSDRYSYKEQLDAYHELQFKKGPELQEEIRHDDRRDEEIPGLPKKGGQERIQEIVASKLLNQFWVFSSAFNFR